MPDCQSRTPADSGWSRYDAIGHAPAWWSIPAATQLASGQVAPVRSASPQPSPAESVPTRRKRAKPAPEDDGAALFGVSDVVELEKKATSLGTQVIGSGRMAAQRQFVRRAPDNESVAALINALVQAGGRLTVAEAASAVGQPPVRMSGYLAQAIRMLNVEGSAILQTLDAGRTVELNVSLLRQQFSGT